MRFRNKVLNGLKWIFLGQFSGQFISIAISLLMARWIAPEYFGKVTMINVVVGFSSIFLDMGFGAALIQKNKVEQHYFSTVFVLNLVLGLLLSILLYSTAGILQAFYNQQGLSVIAKILSPIFIFNALGNIPRTYLSKKMMFKKLSIFGFLSLILGGLTGLLFAYYGLPLHAILGQILVQALFSNVLPLLFGNWKISLVFSRKALSDISSFSMYLLGNNALNYWVRNIDNLLIGKYLGSHQLGIYSKSYAFLIIPLNNTSRAISKVLFPSLSEIQSDKIRVKNLYLNVIGTISLLIFPLMIGGFVTIDKLVVLMLGHKWVESIEIIKVFCLLAMIQSVSSMVPNLYLSQGRANLMFKVGTSLRVLLITAIVIGLFWGIKGVAISYLIAGTISATINSYYSGRLINLTLTEIARQLILPLVFSTLMGIVVYYLDVFFADLLNIRSRLVIQIILGVVIYFLLNEGFKPNAYKSFKALIFEKIMR